MLRTPDNPIVATHWGTYRAKMQDGRAVELVGIKHDPEPSPIAGSMIGALEHPSRIAAPMARAQCLSEL